VGHCGKWWVWVPEQGRREFTDFTLAILDIATLAPSAAPASSHGTKLALATLYSFKTTLRGKDAEKIQRMTVVPPP